MQRSRLSSSSSTSDPLIQSTQPESSLPTSPSIEDAAQLLQSVSQSLLSSLEPNQASNLSDLDSTPAQEEDGQLSLDRISGQLEATANGVHAQDHDRHSSSGHGGGANGAVQSVNAPQLQTQVRHTMDMQVMMSTVIIMISIPVHRGGGNADGFSNLSTRAGAEPRCPTDTGGQLECDLVTVPIIMLQAQEQVQSIADDLAASALGLCRLLMHSRCENKWDMLTGTS